MLTTLVGRDASSVGSLQARAQQIMFLAVMASGVAGGFMYRIGPSVPVYAGAVAAAFSAGVALTFAGGATAAAQSGGPRAASSGGTQQITLLPDERAWTTYYVLTRAFMLAAFVGMLPHFLINVIEVDAPGLVVVLAGFTLAASWAAGRAQDLIRWIGPRRYPLVSAAMMIVAFVVFAYTDRLSVSVGAMFLLGLASGGVRPSAMAMLTRASVSRRDVEMRSIVAAMERNLGITNACLILAGGLLIAATSFTVALMLLTGTYVAVQAMMMVRRRFSSAGFADDPPADPVGRQTSTA